MGNMEVEKLKKEFINEARIEYEGKLTNLRLTIKQLQDRNQHLEDLRALLGGK
jgi:hypothetical protein